MPKERREKIIFAGLIFFAFLIANLFSNGSFKGLTGKSEDEIIINDSTEDEIGNDKSNDISEDNLMSSEMKVYISGEVINSGVYDIIEGDRLDDLVKKAGGFTEKADLDSINLALRLEDQMKIYIPNIDENQNININNSNPSQGVVSQDMDLSGNSKINLNFASKEELMTLPNIGEKRAQAILEYRQEKKFEKIEDIKNVSGIGDKFFESMKDLITV
ncbi:DUF655 domain-containing protein [uncultured Anaerococcus sp.]|uniref:DUF655 domain-containing protein n=1 Tax=uncultured Anaerococcus sp. TaxID=293428 RepID=UPI0025EACAE5|nr:DUF655 domain-containing protein [uncultured Anaerococcus sp.]